MMTSTSEVPSDPPVSMPSDDDQAKAGSNTTHTMECDTDPGTSLSPLVNLHLDSSSSVSDIRSAFRYLVICLTCERNKLHKARKGTRKIRGLWKTPPEGWPENEPFLDPNNNRKPQQDALFRMYETAKSLYIKKYPKNIPTMGGMPLTSGSRPQPSVTGPPTYDHLEMASGGDAVNKRQQQGTQPEESNMSTLCQPTLSELRIKHLGLGSPDASRNMNDRQNSDTEVTGNQGVMIAGGTYPMVGKDVPRPQLQVVMDPVTSAVSETLIEEALDANSGTNLQSQRLGLELVNLDLDSSSHVSDIRSAYRYLVIVLTYGLDKLHEAGKETLKMRGLWKTRLEGWPENEPFLDPNNKHGDEGKPQKEALLGMYKIAKSLFTKKYGQASDGLSPTLESFQSQPPEAGHWDSALPKTAAGGSDVTSLRQGKQPEESSMSTPCQPTCSELGIKRLVLGLPADCIANDRQDSNAEVNENQGGLTIGCVPVVVKEGPGPEPGPGSLLQVVDQVLEVVGVAAPMTGYDAGQAEHAPVESQCSDSSTYTLDIVDVSMVSSAVSSPEIEIVDVHVSPIAGEAGSEIRLPVYSSYEEPQHPHVQNEPRKRKQTPVVDSDPGTALETLSHEAPGHDKGFPASDLIDQLKLLDDDGAETTGLSTGEDSMFSGQLTDIPTDNPLVYWFSKNNVSSREEPQYRHVQNEPRKRKQTPVVENDSGQAPKRTFQVPSATESQTGPPTTEITCNLCGNVRMPAPFH